MIILIIPRFQYFIEKIFLLKKKKKNFFSPISKVSFVMKLIDVISTKN